MALALPGLVRTRRLRRGSELIHKRDSTIHERHGTSHSNSRHTSAGWPGASAADRRLEKPEH